MKTLKNLILVLILLFALSCKSDGQMIPGIGQVICPRATGDAFTPVNYGFLYNYATIAGINDKSIANTGWRVLHGNDIDPWVAYWGGSGNGAWKCMETGTIHWFSNPKGTNEFKLGLKGSGYINASGAFISLKYIYIVGVSNFNNWAMTIGDSGGDTGITTGPNWGLSVMLVKLSTTLTNGQTGIYTGNDGKTYLTVCVAGKEMVAGALAETMLRDKTPIPLMTSAAEWTAASTFRMAAPNYDINNK